MGACGSKKYVNQSMIEDGDIVEEGLLAHSDETSKMMDFSTDDMVRFNESGADMRLCF
jgi:hypothetical protein